MHVDLQCQVSFTDFFLHLEPQSKKNVDKNLPFLILEKDEM